MRAGSGSCRRQQRHDERVFASVAERTLARGVRGRLWVYCAVPLCWQERTYTRTWVGRRRSRITDSLGTRYSRGGRPRATRGTVERFGKLLASRKAAVFPLCLLLSLSLGAHPSLCCLFLLARDIYIKEVHVPLTLTRGSALQRRPKSAVYL